MLISIVLYNTYMEVSFVSLGSSGLGVINKAGEPLVTTHRLNEKKRNNINQKKNQHGEREEAP